MQWSENFRIYTGLETRAEKRARVLGTALDNSRGNWVELVK